jgi:hypothetical protein
MGQGSKNNHTSHWEFADVRNDSLIGDVAKLHQERPEYILAFKYIVVFAGRNSTPETILVTLLDDGECSGCGE